MVCMPIAGIFLRRLMRLKMNRERWHNSRIAALILALKRAQELQNLVGKLLTSSCTEIPY